MKPIIMSPPMVVKILEGIKKRTTRILPKKFYPRSKGDNIRAKKRLFVEEWCFMDGYRQVMAKNGLGIVVPKYIPGDTLYVRENINARGPHPIYVADGKNVIVRTTEEMSRFDRSRIIPSIHVPKIYSRLFLHVDAVKLSRIWDLCYSAQFIFEEGFEAVKEYSDYWDMLNLKRGFPYEDNPWVWDIQFHEVR